MHLRDCSVFTEKNPHIREPAQFKPVLLKDQLGFLFGGWVGISDIYSLSNVSAEDGPPRFTGLFLSRFTEAAVFTN